MMAGLLLALVVYHLLTIHRQSLFVDEVWELHHARESFAQIPRIPDSMPPLFSWMLKAWVGLFGENAARWLPAVCSMGAVVAAWWFMRRIFSATEAVAAAVLLTVSPFVLFYAQHIRAYALFLLLATASIGASGLAVRTRDGRYFWLWVAMAVVGMWTHYYYAFVIAVTLLLILAAGDVSWKRLACGLGVLVLLTLPLLGPLRIDFFFQRDLYEPRKISLLAMLYTYGSFFTGYAIGPSIQELHLLGPRQALADVAPVAIAAAFVAVVLGLFAVRRLRATGLLVPVVTLFVLPTLLVGGTGLVSGITYNTRFLVWVVVPFAVAMACGAVEGWRTLPGKMATVVLLGISLVANSNRLLEGRYQNEDFRSVAAYLAEVREPDEAVHVLPGYLELVARHYQVPEDAVRPLPGEKEMVGTVDSVEEAERIASRLAESDQGYWLIYSREFHGDPEGLLLSMLLGRKQIELAGEFAGVKVYHHAGAEGVQRPAADSAS